MEVGKLNKHMHWCDASKNNYTPLALERTNTHSQSLFLFFVDFCLTRVDYVFEWFEFLTKILVMGVVQRKQ